MTPAVPPDAKTPRSTAEDADAVVRRLREAGHVAYFAGGCVRDMLLGAEPNDWDVATDAHPKRVRELFSNTQAVGAAFGVILVRHRSSVIEVATFRVDMEYTDGRHPQGVRFTTANEDARRRDFTINGLFFDPVEKQVLDFVGGQADLKARVIRAIGEPDRRFEEDHLRLLRAIRFSARLDFQIEPQTADAIRRHASQLKRISPERIADELRTMLTAPTRGRAWNALWEMELVPEIFRFLPDVAGAGSRSDCTSIVGALPTGDRISFGLALAACVVSLGDQWHGKVLFYGDPSRLPRVSRAFRQGLKISNEEGADAEGTLAGIDIVLSEKLSTIAQCKRFLARPTAPHSRALLLAIAKTRSEFSDRVQSAEQMFKGLDLTDYAPMPLVTGDDLTAAGLSPGPLFKCVLDAVYDLQLEGAVSDKEEAIRQALALANQ